jgi:hypothetical protein
MVRPQNKKAVSVLKLSKRVSTITVSFHYRISGLRRTYSLVTHLCARIKHLHLWVASRNLRDIPSQLELTVLTKPLRYSPAVLRYLKPWLSRVISDITIIPNAGEGADVILLHHHGGGHRGF